MPETISIPLSDLLIDTENPRLELPNVGQREALRELAKHQGKRLTVLARDILERGLNPSELPIVKPIEGTPGKYVVLEGNRRITTLKALENPETFKDAITPSVLSAIRKLSAEFQKNPIDSLTCVVVENAEDANHWIVLRHTKDNDGAGVLKWGADEADRFKARSSGKKRPHTQVLDFLVAKGLLTSEERRDVPSSSVQRLLETPEVREALGVKVVRGELQLLAEEAKVATALAFVVKDLLKGKAVKEIYTREDRIAYVSKLPKSVVVDANTKSKVGTPIAEATLTAKSQARPRGVRVAPPRDVLIHKSCVMEVTEARVQAIERELRTLSLEKFPNAVSVLLRVFVELSVDSYIDRLRVEVTPEGKLGYKLTKVLEDLLARKKLAEKQAKPIRRAAQGDSFLAPSVRLMHEYVHNQYVSPSPTDLRANWDNLQPFLSAIWSH